MKKKIVKCSSGTSNVGRFMKTSGVDLKMRFTQKHIALINHYSQIKNHKTR